MCFLVVVILIGGAPGGVNVPVIRALDKVIIFSLPPMAATCLFIISAAVCAPAKFANNMAQIIIPVLFIFFITNLLKAKDKTVAAAFTDSDFSLSPYPAYPAFL